jgi:hypothetical protein
LTLDAVSADLITKDRTVAVKSWNAALIERERCVPESDACYMELLLKDARGTTRSLARGLAGDFIVLERARRVFSCEYNAISQTKAPILIMLSGSTVSLSDHPGFLRSCSATGSGEEVLLLYSMVEGGRPYNLVRLLDSSGKSILEKRLNDAGDVDFSVSGKTYHAHIPMPELPG